MRPSKRSATTRAISACLLLAAAAASLGGSTAAAALPACPSLQAPSVSPAQRDAVLAACSSQPGAAAPNCAGCHCALVQATAPQLVASGIILASELYSAAALGALTSTLSGCSRDFGLQLLESIPDLRMSQLLALDTCAPTAEQVALCMQARRANATAAAGGAGCAPGGGDAANATAASPCGGDTAAAGGSDGSPARPLRIAASTTRGPMAWRAGCSCEEAWDPVCDPATRRQYPNPCSAQCQYVAQTVPCSELPALVARARAAGSPSSSVVVFDASVARPAGGDELARAAAAAGPLPPAAPAEADPNTQLFYYYYDEAADDSADALAIGSAVAAAMAAARLGGAAPAADALDATLPAAVGAGVAAAASAGGAAPRNVSAQQGPAAGGGLLPGLLQAALRAADGPADANATRAGGLLRGAIANGTAANATAPLRSIRAGAAGPNATERLAEAVRGLGPVTVLSRRRANATGGGAAAVNRTTLDLGAVAEGPAMPSWLSTVTPGQDAAVYSRNADRTSRILAALMAAGRQSDRDDQAAVMVTQLGSGLSSVVQAAQEQAAAAPRAEAAPATPLGGGALVRGALAAGGLNASTLLPESSQGASMFRAAANGTAANGTAPALNGTVAAALLNATNGTMPGAGGMLRALNASRPVERLDAIVQGLDAVAGAGAAAFDSVRKRLGGAGDALAARLAEQPLVSQLQGAIAAGSAGAGASGLLAQLRAASGPAVNSTGAAAISGTASANATGNNTAASPSGQGARRLHRLLLL